MGHAGVGGGCGPCPAAACNPETLVLQVTGLDSGSVVGSLVVQADGVDFTCTRLGCGFRCSTQAQLADGTYSIELSAPGYRTQSIQVEVVSPTSCGCCGCCPFSATRDVVLEPDGSPITGCCADVMTDPNNCGTCGKACSPDAWCAAGKCTPVFAPCIAASDGFASCDDYCVKQGKSCQAACGPSGTESLHWWGQGSVDCSDNIYSPNGMCAQSLAGFVGVRCCCAEE
jgi:hypothetical protein